MHLSISAAGFATAQGGSSDVFSGVNLRSPESWPWPLNERITSPVCRTAIGVDSKLSGLARWRVLVQRALADCFGNQMPAGDTPIFLASCNGGADGFDLSSWGKSFDSANLLEGTPWSGKLLPVFSSSCNSGLHALYAATQALIAGCANEAVVLSADILSRSNQNNFESLRVLADSPTAPWQHNSNGFILGEAAVALKITRRDDDELASLVGPALTSDFNGDGLHRILERMSSAKPALILGQGTGPTTKDESELKALQTSIDRTVPISTPLVYFGHTLGASGLLSVSLACLAKQKQRTPPVLKMPAESACDGRPLVNGLNGSEALTNTEAILVTCGALDGSYAGAFVGNIPGNQEPHDQHRPPPNSWHQQPPIGPLMHPVLRRIAHEARAYHPLKPPDILVVSLDEPLAPPPEAWFGERLLPSAVLEMTPGFVSQLVARSWGFAGPALCLVGNTGGGKDEWDLISACKKQALTVCKVEVAGTGDKREIVWNN